MAQAVCCFYPLVFRYLTTPMAFPQHFKKPPIFPSEEVNRIRSCWNPRLPFSCCTSPLLGAGAIISFPGSCPSQPCGLATWQCYCLGPVRPSPERVTAVKMASNLLFMNGWLTIYDGQNSGLGSPSTVTGQMLFVTWESHLIVPISLKIMNPFSSILLSICQVRHNTGGWAFKKSGPSVLS